MTVTNIDELSKIIGITPAGAPLPPPVGADYSESIAYMERLQKWKTKKEATR